LLTDRFFANILDVNINGIELPVQKYVSHVWRDLSYNDYVTLVQKEPSQAVVEHELYKDYRDKLVGKTDAETWKTIIEKEKEKLFYFALTYGQKVVLVKSGEKSEEKLFLGYEFSNRRGNEGIHALQKDKSIDECTKLFDPEMFDNPEKASTYIYKAFHGDHDFKIADELQQNIVRNDLVDMLTFDRVDFEKSISLSIKKKRNFESQWPSVKIGSVIDLEYGKGLPDKSRSPGEYPVMGSNGIVGFHDQFLIEGPSIIVGRKGSAGKITVVQDNSYPIDTTYYVKIKGANLDFGYCALILKQLEGDLVNLNSGLGPGGLNRNDAYEIKIPLPPIVIQRKLANDFQQLDDAEISMKSEIVALNNEVYDLIFNSGSKSVPLRNLLAVINPEKASTVKDLPLDTDVSFLSMADVSNEGLIVNLQKRKLRNVKNGFTFFQTDDVLFAKITPCMENGKGALIGTLENNIGFGSTEFFVLRRNKDRILPKILFYITKSSDFRTGAEKVMTGASGHRRVPKSFIEDYLVPDLSLAEQSNIVLRIEQIEAKIEKLEMGLDQSVGRKEETLKRYL
jgi:type I restriction enzyme M protein